MSSINISKNINPISGEEIINNSNIHSIIKENNEIKPDENKNVDLISLMEKDQQVIPLLKEFRIYMSSISKQKMEIMKTFDC